MKRKILSLILVFAMTVSLLTVGTGAVEPAYGDTAGHWAESSIERWSGHGIIQGSNGLFDPNGQLTCAQLATILAKLLKLPAAKDAGFTDNTADAWYYDAINRCAAAGILNGNGDGTVTPDAPISRERAMVMLARALGIEPIREPDLTKYSDAAKVAPYAQGMVAAMIEAGIVGGVTADELAPQDNINRASTVTILDRAISTYANEAGTTVEASSSGITLVAADNVTITGSAESVLVAQGALDGTVTLSSSSAGSVTVTAENATVYVTSESKADDVTLTETAVDSKVVVLKGAQVGTVTTAAPGSTVSVSGKVETVTTTETAEKASVEVAKNATVGEIAASGEKTEIAVSGKVENVTVSDTAADTTVKANSGSTISKVDNAAEGTTVSGSGKVENVTTSGDNTTVSTPGTKVEASEGTSGTTAGGKDVAGGSSSTTGGSSSSGSSSSGGSSGPTYYTVTFDTNGGNAVASQSVVSGGKASQPAAPTQDGKTFLFWSTSKDTPTAYDFNTAITGNVTLYAIWVDETAVAVIGVNGYDMLAGALAAAEEGDTVTLLKDITGAGVVFDKNVNATLDLNGKTFKATSNGNVTKHRVILINKGTLTIQNGTLDARNEVDGTDARDDTAMYGTVRAEGGNIILKNLTLYNNHDWGMSIKVCSGQTGTIENCTVISKVGGGLEAEGGNITVKNSAFTQTGSNPTYGYIASGLAVSFGGTVDIDNTAFTTSGDYALYVFSSGGTINAKSGNFAGTEGVAIVQQDHSSYPERKSVINISGGTYTGIIKSNGGEYNEVSITGGTFTVDPRAYVVAGYGVTEADGKYTVSALFAGGSGTEADPFLISSADQLKAFRDSVNAGTTYSDKYIQLTTDINLNNEKWLPIGEKAGDKFSGTFDGRNHIIEGLSITATPEIGTKATFDGYAGFFGAINGGTVKNLSVYGSVSGKNVAGVVARVDGNSSVKNCHNHANVTATSDGKAGGVICLTNTATISVQDCTNSGTVSGGKGGTAGIIGYANAGVTISGCKNNGNIGDANSKYSGGIVGYVTGDNSSQSITNCTNSGIIVAFEECGGIVGIITGTQNVSDCTNTQSVNGTDAAASGGIVGSFANGTIKDCTNTASVHGRFAGGVVGSAQKGTIENCSGGTAAITSPAFTLGFTGHTFTLTVTENQAAGRILGTNQGSGSDNYTVLKLANDEDDHAIGTVGMCGNLTTWANLKISSGTFYGEPLAGNTTYITLEAGATWGNKAVGTYYRGGLTESSRIATWQIKN